MSLSKIERAIPTCTRCPELRAYCTEVARAKRRAFADWDYWGRPIPGFGDPQARIWVIGLAPAAHGGNRTGRVFTGDRSGDFLFAALHRAALANQPTSVSRDDGLALSGVYVSASLRCAPPANKPTPRELENCSSYLDEEEHALSEWRAIVALGGIAWSSVLAMLARRGHVAPRPKPKFAHGARVAIDGGRALLGCYHVSQQNTFTGKLTEPMIDAVLARAKEIARIR